MVKLLHAALTLLAPLPSVADSPQVAAVTRTDAAIAVTLIHPDSGWGHYADGWRVETEDGQILGTRELTHPHVDEQPFTRSLRLFLPASQTPLVIRAGCSQDGWSETTFPLAD